MTDRALHPLPSSRLRRWSRWLLIGVLTGVVIIAVLLGSFSIVMARVPGSKAQLQSWLSEQAKLHVSFADVRARWRYFGPELEFTDAVVRSQDGQRILIAAHRGGVGFDLWTALRTRRIAAGRFSLSGTELQAIRREDGSVELLGQADLPQYERTESLNLDALPVGELQVDGVRFSFRDLKTGRGPWVVNDVAFTVRRDARLVRLQGQATLPSALGKTLSFNARADGSLADVQALQWRASVTGVQLDLAGWAQVMPDDWIAPRKGVGSFGVTAEFIGGAPQRLTGNLRFVDVAITPPAWSIPLPQAAPLEARDSDGQPVARDEPPATPALLAAGPVEYSRITMDVDVTRVVDGWHADFNQVQFSREGSDWAPGHLMFDIRRNEQGSRLHASAQLLVLDNLWPLLAYLPENEANAAWRALNASGQLRDIDLKVERDAGAAPVRYGVRAAFAQLGVSAVGRQPGVTGLSGSVQATGARGELLLDSHDLTLSIPWLFRTPLPADEITAKVAWTRDAGGIHVPPAELSIHTPDGRGQFNIAMTLPAGGEPVIDLKAELQDLNVAATPRYIPAGVTPPATLKWLDGAFSAGTVTTAHAEITGPIRHFPFRDKSGQFIAVANIDGLSLNYQQGWAPATELKVKAEFRNTGLSATAQSGRVNGLRIEQASGSLPDYREAEIRIKARGRGDLHDALEYVQQSPVGPSIGDLFQQLRGEGAITATANLFFPLKRFAQHQLRFDVNLDNGIVGLEGITQRATGVSGQLQIVNDAVTATTLNGQFLGGRVAASAVPVRRGRFNIQVDGHAQADALTQFLHLPGFIKLEGETDYRFTTPGYGQHSEDGRRQLFAVDSSLEGLAINLPAPLNKSRKSARAFHAEAQLRDNNTMELRGSLDDVRSVVRLKHDEGWRFERGTVRADGVMAALPAHTGLRVEGALDRIVLDDWIKLGTGTGTSSGASSGTGSVRLQDVLKAANVTINHFRLYGFEWNNLRGILQATDAGWRVDVSGEQATGQVNVPYTFSGSRPLTVDMEQLTLTPLSAKEGDAAAPSTLDPRDLPAVQARVKSFHFDQHDFGALTVSASRVPQGFQLDSAQIVGPSFNGNGTGNWLQTAEGIRSRLDFSIDSTDVRATMQQLNYGDFVAAKQGTLTANLSWPGGVDADLLGRASGTLKMSLNDGQLLSVQPGAGRVIGLLSIAALPRRLRLDFRDVTDKGLSFDSVHGDFTVTNGDAHTQNLLLRGPSAEVGIVGRIGLGKHDYDQTAVVTGEVGSALPLAGAAIAANPVVGAALLLFSQIFKEPLKGVTRAYYHIGGSWDNPVVERMDSGTAKAAQAEEGTQP